MQSLSVCIDTYYGAREFSFNRTSKKTSYNINVPFGTTENLYLTNDKVTKLGSGEYRIEI